MWDWISYYWYFLVTTLSFFILVKYDKVKNNNSKLLIIGLLPLFVMMAFRGEDVGNDLVRYGISIKNANSLETTDISILAEPFFVVIYWCSNILGGLQPFIVITSFLQILFLYIGCKKFKKHGLNVAIIVILFWGYLSIRSFSMVRNGIAVACAFCAFASLLNTHKFNKGYWWYTFWAIGFHTSAILCIPIYFICRPFNKVSRTKIKADIFLRASVLVATTLFVMIAAKSQIFDILYTINDGKYSGFESRDEFGIGNFLIRLPLLVITLCQYKQLNKQYGNRFIPFFLLLLVDIAVSQLKYLSQNFERFTMITQIGEIVILSMYFQYLIKRDGKIWILGAYIFCIAYFTYYLYHWSVNGGDGYGNGNMPYKVWSSQ